MTLDELIIELTKDKACAEVPIEECVKVHCHKCEYSTHIELKDILPVVLETKKELEVYKKLIIQIYDELNKDKKEVINALIGSVNPSFVEMFFKPRCEKCNCDISQEEVKNDLFEEEQE